LKQHGRQKIPRASKENEDLYKEVKRLKRDISFRRISYDKFDQSDISRIKIKFLQRPLNQPSSFSSAFKCLDFLDF